LIDSVYETSRSTLQIEGTSPEVNDELNSKLIDLGIPYKCLIEDKATIIPQLGRKYFYVDSEQGVIQKDDFETGKAVLLKGKNHTRVQRCHGGEDDFQF
jgi:hypothetical protein